MKRKILTFTLSLLLICSSMFVLSACSNDETKKSIEVSGMETTYYIGEELDLTGSKIFYFENDLLKETTEISKDMVSNFDTSTAGNKTMTITYAGVSKDVSYTVLVNEYTIEEGRAIYANAVEYTLQQTDFGSNLGFGFKGNIYYDGMDIDSGSQDWTYYYEDKVEEYKIRTVMGVARYEKTTSNIDGFAQRTADFQSFCAGGLVGVEVFEVVGCSSVTQSDDGSIAYVFEDDSTQSECTIVIKGEKFISLSQENNGRIESITYLYGSDFTIPELPDVEWVEAQA